MELRDLFEGQWWDDTPTITLYHGTSSVLLPLIQREGLVPPSATMAQYVRAVLSDILPDRQQWPPGFVVEAIRRLRQNRRNDRRGDGMSLYFFPVDRDDTPSAASYARAYAEHGGEIAYHVWWYLKGYCEENGLPEPPKRWPEGRPVVLTVEVPKAWCLWDADAEMRDRLEHFWRTRHPHFTDDYGKPYDRLEDLLVDAVEDREVRVNRTIPPEMITAVRNV